MDYRQALLILPFSNQKGCLALLQVPTPIVNAYGKHVTAKH